ncbi:MAG: hypothetical protein KDC83_08270 [Flavobacteriales bacterium]|nr:hypothetical protein [Flavobacteriales bacterium]
MENTEKLCLECERPLIGRIDKKFCNDFCRNGYYNRKNRVTNNYVRKINRILSKNREILFELNPEETSKSTKAKMLQEGFNFNYFTNVFETKTGKSYYFCYDKGFLFLEDDKVALVTKKDYVQ